jgi:predicted Zn-dependent protease with MMP-like domain
MEKGNWWDKYKIGDVSEEEPKEVAPPTPERVAAKKEETPAGGNWWDKYAISKPAVDNEDAEKTLLSNWDSTTQQFEELRSGYEGLGSRYEELSAMESRTPEQEQDLQDTWNKYVKSGLEVQSALKKVETIQPEVESFNNRQKQKRVDYIESQRGSAVFGDEVADSLYDIDARADLDYEKAREIPDKDKRKEAFAKIKTTYQTEETQLLQSRIDAFKENETKINNAAEVIGQAFSTQGGDRSSQTVDQFLLETSADVEEYAELRDSLLNQDDPEKGKLFREASLMNKLAEGIVSTGVVNGEVRISPSAVWNAELVKQEIAELDVSEAQKQLAIASIPRMQEEAAKLELPFLQKVNEFNAFVKKNNLQGESPKDQISEWKSRTRNWSEMITKAPAQVGIGLTQGALGLLEAGQAIVGGTAMTMGAQKFADPFLDAATQTSERNQELGRISQEIGGPTLLAELAAVAPQIALQIGIGKTVSFGGTKLGLKPKMVSNLGFGSSVGTAMAQSYGGVLSSAFQQLEKEKIDGGMDPIQARAEAIKEAQLPAALSGLSTAIVTAIGGKRGVEAPFREGVAGIRAKLNTAAFRAELPRLIPDVIKGMRNEGYEELADQLAQGIIEQFTFNPELSTSDIINNAVKALVIGGITGGTVEGLKYGFDYMRAPKEMARRETSMASIRQSITDAEKDISAASASSPIGSEFQREYDATLPSDEAAKLGAIAVDRTKMSSLQAERQELAELLEDETISKVARNQLEGKLAAADVAYYNEVLAPMRRNVVNEQLVDQLDGMAVSQQTKDSIVALSKIANGLGAESLTGRERVAVGITSIGEGRFLASKKNPMVEIGEDGRATVTEAGRLMAENVGMVPLVRMIGLSESTRAKQAEMERIVAELEAKKAQQEAKDTAESGDAKRYGPASAEALKQQVAAQPTVPETQSNARLAQLLKEQEEAARKALEAVKKPETPTLSTLESYDQIQAKQRDAREKFDQYAEEQRALGATEEQINEAREKQLNPALEKMDSDWRSATEAAATEWADSVDPFDLPALPDKFGLGEAKIFGEKLLQRLARDLGVTEDNSVKINVTAPNGLKGTLNISIDSDGNVRGVAGYEGGGAGKIEGFGLINFVSTGFSLATNESVRSRNEPVRLERPSKIQAPVAVTPTPVTPTPVTPEVPTVVDINPAQLAAQKETPFGTVDPKTQVVDATGRIVPRYMWHSPPSGLKQDQGVVAYVSREAGAQRAIDQSFGGKDVKTVWLGVFGRDKGMRQGAFTIDLAKLDPANIMYTGQAEGNVWYRGDVPEYAIDRTGTPPVQPPVQPPVAPPVTPPPIAPIAGAITEEQANKAVKAAQKERAKKNAPTIEKSDWGPKSVPTKIIAGGTARQALITASRLNLSKIAQSNPNEIMMQDVAAILAELDMPILDLESVATLSSLKAKGRPRRWPGIGSVIGMPSTIPMPVKTLVHELGHTLTADQIRRYLPRKKTGSGKAYLDALNKAIADPKTPEAVSRLFSLYVSTIDQLGITEQYFGKKGVAGTPKADTSKAMAKRLQAKGLLRKDLKGDSLYGFANVEEFVSQTFSETPFRDLLKTLKDPTNPQRTLWQAFVDAIQAILQLPKGSMAAGVIQASIDVGMTVPSDRALGQGRTGTAPAPAAEPDMAPESETGKTVGMSLDASNEAMFKLFGERMYTAELSKVVVKETVQNAFDGIKDAEETGEIPKGSGVIAYSRKEHEVNGQKVVRMTFTDNGAGMTPDILQKAFFTVGGSFKRSGKGSGGFGIAKLGMFMSADNVMVETVRDGVKSVVKISKQQLIDKKFDAIVSDAPDRKNGTMVVLEFPEEISRSDGKVVKFNNPVPLFQNMVRHDVLIINDNYGSYEKEIVGKFRGEPESSLYTWQSVVGGAGVEPPTFEKIVKDIPNVEVIEKEFPVIGAKKPIKVRIAAIRLGMKGKDGKDKYNADFQVDGKSLVLGNSEMNVYSNGLYQFQKGGLKLKPLELFRSPRLPYHFIIDIDAGGVDAKSLAYPFQNNREGFQDGTIKDYVNKFIDDVRVKEVNRQFDQTFGLLTDINGGKPRKDSPSLYNNTTIVPEPYEQKFLEDLSRAVFDVADDLVVALRKGYEDKILEDAWYKVKSQKGLAPTLAESNEDTLDYFYGVGLSKNWGGVNTSREPVSALVNPIYEERVDEYAKTEFGRRVLARTIAKTLIHEINHHLHRNEGSNFTFFILQNEAYLGEVGAIQSAVDKILPIVNQYSDAIISLKNKFRTAETKDTDNELTGEQYERSSKEADGQPRTTIVGGNRVVQQSSTEVSARPTSEEDGEQTGAYLPSSITAGGRKDTGIGEGISFGEALSKALVENQAQTTEGGVSLAQQDSDHLTAVESGDTKTAQRLTDEIAAVRSYQSQNLLFHGTTHIFNVFRKDRVNIENDFGKGYYLTNTEADAEINYAGEGPDLTSRIERMSEQLEEDENLTRAEALKKATEILSGGGPPKKNLISFQNRSKTR